MLVKPALLSNERVPLRVAVPSFVNDRVSSMPLLMLTAPWAIVWPVPAIVPPVQVRGPVTVNVPGPSRVPPVRLKRTVDRRRGLDR